MKLIKTSIVGVIICVSCFAGIVNAATAPDYPSCLNPVGTVKAQYDTGIHGIVGDNKSYQGKDIVYSTSEIGYMQCFCADNGHGIQTNWWKVPYLSKEEIDSYVQKGWIFVPDGTAWGLTDDPYLAKNIVYSCKNNGGSGGSSSSSSSSTSSSSSSQSIGGQVLALASTGNIVFIYSIAFAGIALMAAGIVVSRKSNKN